MQSRKGKTASVVYTTWHTRVGAFSPRKLRRESLYVACWVVGGARLVVRPGFTSVTADCHDSLGSFCQMCSGFDTIEWLLRAPSQCKVVLK